MKARAALVSLLLQLATAGAAGAATSTAPAGDPLGDADLAPPGLRLPDLARPLGYTIDLTLEPGKDVFQGQVDIEIEVRKATRILWLHAAAIELDTVAVRAAGAAVAVRTVTAPGDLLGLVLAHPIEPGKAKLHVAYRGKLHKNDTHGLFTQQESGDWYVFSQFESTYARRAFPCFDEPGFKVPFQVTLHLPRDLVAASNTPVEKEERGKDGFKTVVFARTPPLPSYLVAIAIGPFDVVEAGVVGAQKRPLRILAPRGRAAEARLAAETTPVLVERLERYFGIPYPFSKLDLVAVPQTVAFGAMENPGLITYTQTGLLNRKEDLSIAQRRSLASTTAHELAHQWFGDLVTMQYWDDVWLNEGFASWMGGKTVAEWRPEWDQGVGSVRSRARAMGADSLVAARQIRQPIQTQGDILNAFDGITYSKGAAVLSMFESWMGEDRFRDGIRRYLTAHAWGNATAEDFLAALSAAEPAVGPAFASFLNQPGIPLVTVELACESGKTPRARLAQRRFLPTGSTGSSAQTWQIPVCLRYGAGDSAERTCKLMTAASDEIELKPAAGCPDWLLANAGEIGYYRVAYRGDLLAQLLAGGGRRLTLPERVGVLSDVSALVQAGELTMAEALAFVPDFARDPSRHVVASMATVVGGLNDHLVTTELRPSYVRFVGELFGERAAALGLTPKPDDDEDTRLLRQSLVELVGDKGEDKVLRAEARRLARAWLDDRSAVHPDLVGTVLSLAAIDGDRELFARFRTAAKNTTERRDRRRLLGAMGSFRDPEMVKTALALVAGDEFDIRESMTVLWSALEDERTRELAWEFFRASFDTIATRIPSESGAGLPRIAGSFCDAEHRAAAESFLRPRVAQFPGAERNLNQALERVDLCIANRRAQQPSVAAFLAKYGAPGVAASAPPERTK